MKPKSIMSILIVIGLGLTACGSSGATSALSTTTVSINLPADRASAEAINLTAADLPGWQESPNPPDTADASLGSQLSSCVGGPDENNIDVVDVTSSNFTKGSVELSSDVTMIRSHADAVADVGSVKSPELQACVEKILKPTLAKDLPIGATITELQANTFKPSESLPDGLGLRLTMTLEATVSGVTRSVPFYISQIGFVVGRAEVTLLENEMGQLANVPLEASLLNLLLTQAQHHAGA